MSLSTNVLIEQEATRQIIFPVPSCRVLKAIRKSFNSTLIAKHYLQLELVLFIFKETQTSWLMVQCLL